MKSIRYIITLTIATLTAINSFGWGFYSHKLINKQAIFILPPEMIAFYKNHIDYITEHAVDPDKRSHGVEGEAVKHYFDVERYGDSALLVIPHYWKDAVKKYTEDTLQLYGINPWWISKMAYTLTQAFKDLNVDKILFYSANLGHYIADATVPLHTSEYYDGKSLEQKGIHAFWETRLPELFADKYNFFVGKAEYIPNIQEFAWKLVTESHNEVDTVFQIEEFLRKNFPDDKKFAFETKGNIIKKQYSEEYSKEFIKMSKNMIERKLRNAIKAVGSIWYTCWVNSGQPNMKNIESKEVTDELKKEQKETDKMWKTGKPKGRPNPE
jgi:hypothetical protein